MRRWWKGSVILVVLACSTETADPLALTRLSTFTDSLGQARGATFGEAGSVYVADALMKAIYRLDDSTTLNLFRNGMGPGEVMQPVDVNYDDGILSVLDAGKGGTSTFSDGEFVAFRHEDFWPGSRYISGTGKIENPLSALVQSQTPSGIPVQKEYTNSCREGNRTYEMSVLDGTTLVLEGTELHSTNEAVIVPLGMACSDDLVVVGYGVSGRLFYQFYTANMDWLGSREFANAEESNVLGNIFALRGDTLLTGRTRPLPKVELWSVEY